MAGKLQCVQFLHVIKHSGSDLGGSHPILRLQVLDKCLRTLMITHTVLVFRLESSIYFVLSSFTVYPQSCAPWGNVCRSAPGQVCHKWCSSCRGAVKPEESSVVYFYFGFWPWLQYFSLRTSDSSGNLRLMPWSHGGQNANSSHHIGREREVQLGEGRQSALLTAHSGPRWKYLTPFKSTVHWSDAKSSTQSCKTRP